MNRNQKIAIGCGGVGCLGLIVLVIIGVVAWRFLGTSLTTNSNRNRNYNFNLNTNSESNSSETATESESDSTSSSSAMSDDDKHKLFQAATMTQDAEIFQRVMKKLGLMDASGTNTREHEQFVTDHFTWAMKNLSFIQSINTPDKAKAYVEAHIDD